MSIHQKLFLGFIGSSILVGVAGASFLLTNKPTKEGVSELKQPLVVKSEVRVGNRLQ